MKSAVRVLVALAAFFCVPAFAQNASSCISGGPCVIGSSYFPAAPKYWNRDALADAASSSTCVASKIHWEPVSHAGPFDAGGRGYQRWRGRRNSDNFDCGYADVYHCDTPGYWFDGSNCVAGNVPPSACENGWQPSADGSVCEPPPPLDCGREAGKVVRAKLGSANAQNWCFETGQTVDPNGDITPDNFVTGSCQGVVDPSGTLITDLASGELVGSFRLTGQPCSDPNPDVPEPTVEEPEAPDEVCVTGSSGTKACVSKDNPANCGEFNGQKICVDSPPPGNCTFFGGGNWVCDSNAPTPPAPADPPGSTTPAQPEFQQSGRGPTGQPSTVNIYPPGVEGGDSGSTYTPPDTGGAGVGDGQGDAACGGEGQPPCKIDETGTPEFDSGELGDPTSGLDDVVDTVGAMTGTEAGSASDLDAVKGDIVSALPSGGDCAPIVIEWRGASTVIDGATKLAPLREGLAWLLGILGALSILGLLIRS